MRIQATGSSEALARGDTIAIANAGLVLLAPYLPPYFRRLGLLDSNESRCWADPGAQARAVHLLQYLADGRTDRPDAMLALAKTLCGRPLEGAEVQPIEPSAQEIEVADSLLEAVLAAWPMLRGSSVAALRETFLQREGVLARGEEGWRVTVERKMLDVLVDGVSWSFSMILHPWMPEPVAVSW